MERKRSTENCALYVKSRLNQVNDAKNLHATDLSDTKNQKAAY